MWWWRSSPLWPRSEMLTPPWWPRRSTSTGSIPGPPTRHATTPGRPRVMEWATRPHPN
ncbi:uncharacterized protein METZ01_LOCUS286134, partial [marine metagenome]